MNVTPSGGGSASMMTPSGSRSSVSSAHLSSSAASTPLGRVDAAYDEYLRSARSTCSAAATFASALREFQGFDFDAASALEALKKIEERSAPTSRGAASWQDVIEDASTQFEWFAGGCRLVSNALKTVLDDKDDFFTNDRSTVTGDLESYADSSTPGREGALDLDRAFKARSLNRMRLHGCGRLPQLAGEGTKPEPNVYPVALDTGERDMRLKQVACTGDRCLYLSETGDIYSFGESGEDEMGRPLDGTGTESAYSATGSGFKVVRALILERVLQGRRVMVVGCGHLHSVAITQGGELYSWGRGDHGRLGHGDTKDQMVPRRVLALSENFVRGVACGGAHTVALVVPSSVYTWGLGRNGRLGTGTTESKHEPTPIDVDGVKSLTHAYRALMGAELPRRAKTGPIEQVACGWGFTLLRSASGTVTAFGKGSNGQCGVLPAEDHAIAVEVKALSSIVSISCGYYHSMAIDKHGSLWCWGYGEEGQLGLGDVLKVAYEPVKVFLQGAHAAVKSPSPKSRRAATMDHIPPPCDSPASLPPERISPIPGAHMADARSPGVERIAMIEAGQFHSLLVTSKSAVYACGSNKHGELGLGHMRPVTTFTQMLKLPIRGHVHQIAAGQHFSLILMSSQKRRSGKRQKGGLRSPDNARAGLELCSGKVSMWRQVSLGKRIGKTLVSFGTLNASRAEWKPRYAVLTTGRLQLYRDQTDNEPDFTLLLGPHLKVVARSSRDRVANSTKEGDGDKSSTVTSVQSAASATSESTVCADNYASSEHLVFEIWRMYDPNHRLKKRVSSVISAATNTPEKVPCEMTLLLRLKAKSERRRKRWVLALKRALSAKSEHHKLDPSMSTLEADFSMKKAAMIARRADTYMETWRTKLLPEMRKKGSSRLVGVTSRTLLLRGIPGRLRSEVWPLAIGNSLRITSELFSIYRERGRSQMQRFQLEEGVSPRNVIGAEATIKGISVDLPRTFPGLSLFGKNGDLYHAQLRQVLEAYTCYRPDVGYVQGMSFLAANLVLYIHSPLDCFVCLANLLSASHLFDFFRISQDYKRIERYYAIFDTCLEKEVPSLYAHFKELHVLHDVHTVLYNWLQTLFFQRLSLDVATRIYDCFLLKLRSNLSTRFAFRVAIAIMKLLAPHIDGQDFEIVMKILSAPIDHPVWASCVNEEKELAKAIADVSLPLSAVESLSEIVSDKL